MSSLKFVSAWIVFVLALVSVSLIVNTDHVSALTKGWKTTTQTSSIIPIEIEPICSSEPRSVSEWKVTNKNVVTVKINWNNFQNRSASSYDAPAGVSKMLTGYNAQDPNNTTKFTYADNSEIGQTNATKAACDEQPVTPPCVDGKLHSNLTATYIADNTVRVSTKNGALLCDDVQLYFSSYVMPRNYDGTGFGGNPTAYPQALYASFPITLHASTTGEGTHSIDYPQCENVQFDLYYAPEVTTIGSNGHGTQIIKANIITHYDASCQLGHGGETPTEPENPTQPEQPVTTETTPQVLSTSTEVPAKINVAALPAELPSTGPSNSTLFMLIGLLASAFVYATLYIALPKRAN